MSKKSSSAKFNQLLEELYALQRLGIKVGLEHTQRLLKVCGDPQDNFTAIHIAGTNGKGSTAAMITAILKNANYKVGLYTSPHLLRFNERIRINGAPISDERIVDFMSRYKTAIEEIESTFFEATTAMTFDYFAQEKVDIAVIETGLGGRLDSTNVLNPKVAIISSITLDHTEILGKDLKSIAFEKGGIIKNGVPIVLSPQSDEVKDVLIDIADRKNAKVIYCEQQDIKNINISQNGTKFSWRGANYRTSLIGEHQARNAVLAIEAVKIIDNKISAKILTSGLENVKWPARLQKMHPSLPIYYDVAHNPHGIQVLLDTMSNLFINKPIGIIALKKEKEPYEIIPVLKGRFTELIVTSVPDRGLMNSQDLYKLLIENGVKTQLEPDIVKAIETMNKKVTTTNPGIIFGSHYIGKAIYKEFGFSFDKGII